MKSGLGVVIHYSSRYEKTLPNGSLRCRMDLHRASLAHTQRIWTPQDPRSSLRNAAAAATLCAAGNNDGSYANCGTIAQLEANGYQQDPKVTLVITTATATRWVAQAQHNSGGSAYRYDTETAQIVPIPRF